VVAWIVVAVLVAVSVALVASAVTKDLAGLSFGGKPGARAAALPSGSATPTAATTAPVLTRFDPAAADEANLLLFKDALTKAAHSKAADSVTGKVLMDSLVAAGFDVAAMQRTADQTSANLQTPTLTVSVRLQKSCLIGQFVRSDASVSTELTAPIETQACLIGQTVPVS
jgi:hypothetical protein